MHRYTLQNHQFYLCIRKILFVAQINSPHGAFICCTNRRPEYTNRKKSSSEVPIVDLQHRNSTDLTNPSTLKPKKRIIMADPIAGSSDMAILLIATLMQ